MAGVPPAALERLKLGQCAFGSLKATILGEGPLLDHSGREQNLAGPRRRLGCTGPGELIADSCFGRKLSRCVTGANTRDSAVERLYKLR